MAQSILFLLIGFLLLMKGADFFVDGASSIAKRFHIPSFIIGLTIVAFGTSAPELAVSLSAALKGSNDIAVGNVVGSNLFNLLVVLGASALIKPVTVKTEILRKDYPLSLLVTLLLGILALDTILFNAPAMTLDRLDGIILLTVFALFLFLTLRSGFQHRNHLKQETEKESPGFSMGKSIFILLVGLTGIIIGGDLTVEAAREIARSFGLSEALIGLTIVAIGTSLPELVTSLVAAKKGENDIAVGNVVGSNLFNILLILGLSAAISPMKLSSTYLYDMIILFLVSLFLYLPLLKTGKLERSTGLRMVLAYVVYTIYLIIR